MMIPSEILLALELAIYGAALIFIVVEWFADRPAGKGRTK